MKNINDLLNNGKNISELSDNENNAIYLAVNKDTGEFYIGASSNIKKRIYNHLYTLKNNKHGNKNEDLFQLSFNKSSNIEFKIIPVSSKEEAFSIEKKLIQENLNSNLCLNMTQSRPPIVFTDEIKEKISKGVKDHLSTIDKFHLKDKKISEDHKEKISKASKKHWENEEYRNKIINYINSDKHKNLMSSIHKGKIDSEETKLKKSLAKKGIPQSKELVEKRISSLRGRKRTEEQINNLKIKIRENINNLSEEDNIKRLNRLKEMSILASNKTKKSVIYNGVKYNSISEITKSHKKSSATIYKELKEQGYEVNKK